MRAIGVAGAHKAAHIVISKLGAPPELIDGCLLPAERVVFNEGRGTVRIVSLREAVEFVVFVAGGNCFGLFLRVRASDVLAGAIAVSVIGEGCLVAERILLFCEVPIAVFVACDII